MGSRHFWLLNAVYALALLISLISASTTHRPSDFDLHGNVIEDEHEMKLEHKKNDKTPMAFDSNYNKMLPSQKFDNVGSEENEKPKSYVNKKPVRLDVKMLPDLLKAKQNESMEKPDIILRRTMTEAKKTIPLADDPRFNKMLPEKNTLKENSKENKKSTESDGEDDEDYDEDYDDYYDQLYDESSAENKNNKNTTKSKKEMKLKPIKGDDKDIPKTKETKNEKHEYDDDSDDDDDNIQGEKKNIYSNNVPCPRYCICDRNLNSEKVATCSRLDADIQNFGPDITDLIVVDAGPIYPIVLGSNFFQNIGLKNLNSLRISNCTIQNLHPKAFNGLNELFAVNLTNVGITQIDPVTFATNKHLRLLTISGNDLSSMTAPRTRTKYLIVSGSIEELDLSNNNFKEIQSEAFKFLPNIVYINLANNNLRTLPENLFNSVETIEDLDLSQNKITFLPQEIFKRTALARLDLKYNDIVGDLRFGTNDLQELDLSYNSIKTINNHMFSKMIGLITLNLKGNGITKVQPDSFATLNYLRHIDLSYNNLEQLSSMLFYKNPNLDVIRLNDNAKLSELPPEGFESYTHVFTVYLLDISNCAINSLGRSTFSQMPHLTTLKLSWNNINNMHKDTFSNLKQLTELDLSNNLIVKLDETVFKKNTQMTKLNLSGNPIRDISTKLFQANTRLHELDVSDCELNNVLEEYYYDNQQNLTTAFFDTLRLFNVSFNKIKKISKKNIRLFKNLKTFSFEGNPIKCNTDFKNLIKYLTQKGISSGKILEKSILEIPEKLPAHTLQGWDEITQTVCKRENEKLKLNKQKQKPVPFDNENEDDDDDDEYDDEKDTQIFPTHKISPSKEQDKKILDGLKEEDVADNKKNKNNSVNKGEDENDADDDEDDSADDGTDNDDDEEEEDNDDDEADEDNSKEETDDDTDDEYNYEYEDEDKSKSKSKEVSTTKKAQIKNLGLFVDEVNIIKETDNKFLRGKFDIPENIDVDEDEGIIENQEEMDEIVEFFKRYGHIIALITVLVWSLATIILVIKRKRGERYHMARLLAAKKNSIVYQPLSEEIEKISNKNPKIHRYSKINQV